jgi:hypothetical protein
MFMRNQSNNRFFQFQLFKNLIATINTFALLFFSISAASPANGQAQNNRGLPVFDINKTEHNFGDIYLGESTTVGFTVRNLGAVPLELSENPIVTGKPTVGVYRQPRQQTLRNLLTLAAMPYT